MCQLYNSEVVGCGEGFGEAPEGAQPLPRKKYVIYIYKGSVVRVSASYSSDLTLIVLVDSVTAAGSRTSVGLVEL